MSIAWTVAAPTSAEHPHDIMRSVKAGRFWTHDEAVAVFRAVGLEPLQPYRNIHYKWKSTCLHCGELQFISLHMVATYGYGCLYCNGKRIRPSDAESVLAAKNGAPLEPFPGSAKPWRARCTRCDREVTTTYKQLVRPDRVGICKHCAGKVLSPDHIAAVMKGAHFEPLEPYPGTNRPWTVRCVDCSRTSTPRFSNIQRGHACIYCTNRRRGEQSRKPPRPDQVTARNLEPLEAFPGMSKPWRCRCLKCGREVTPRWGTVLFNGGDGCIKCGAALRGQRQLRNSQEVAAEMLAAGLQPLEPYPGSSEPWRCTCLRCGSLTITRYGSVQRGERGCLTCGNRSSAEKRKKPAEQAEAVMRAAGYEPLEPYSRSGSPWKCRHEKCGNVVTPSLSTIQQGGGGCKSCAEHGIDYDSPALLYLLIHPAHFSVKIGITGTTSISDRIGSHQRRGWELIQTWQVVSGFVAEEMETQVIDYWRDVLGAPASVHRDEMPQGGWTETASLLFVDVDDTRRLVQEMVASRLTSESAI